MQLCNYHHDETQICHIDLCDDFVCDVICWADSDIIVTLLHVKCYMHPCNNFVCDMISWTDTHITDVHVTMWQCNFVIMTMMRPKYVTLIYVTISCVTLYAERIHILQRDCLLCTIWLFVYVTMLRCNNVTNQLYKFMTMPWWDPKMCYIHPCDNFVCDMICWPDIYITETVWYALYDDV